MGIEESKMQDGEDTMSIAPSDSMDVPEITEPWLSSRHDLLGRIQERRKEKKGVSYLNTHPEVEKFHHDEDFRECLDLLETGDIRCWNPMCRCKIGPQDEEGWRVRISKGVREVVSHQMFKGDLWLYCKVDSKRSLLEFRKQCQVNKELRKDYKERITIAGRSLRKGELWSKDSEIKVRERLHEDLDAKQALINNQLMLCEDTNEWDKRTKNAKELKNITVHALKKPENPGPAGETAETHEELYTVERVIGATYANGGVWFLIKWEGWESEHNSWEPAKSLQTPDLIKEFYKEHGKPSSKNLKILTREGEEHEKWLEMMEDIERKQRDSISSKTDSAIFILPSRAPSPLRMDIDNDTDVENDNEMEDSGIISMQADDIEKECLEEREKEVEPPAKRVKKSASPVEMYEVERILGCSRAANTGKLWYLVKWLGYTEDHNTWEPDHGLKTARNAIKEFYKYNKKPTNIRPKILNAEGAAFEEKVRLEELSKGTVAVPASS